MSDTYEVVVSDVREECDGVKSLVLRRADDAELPAWTPGSHVDLILPSGLVRKYSLCGIPADRTCYRISVLADPRSRGGSVELHRIASPGRVLDIAGPRNRFPLVDAERYLFIAGGIGITPILPMVRSVSRDQKDWRLVYGGRSRRSMAYLSDIEALDGERVDVFAEDINGVIDVPHVLQQQPEGTLIFCCGPTGLINAVREAAANYAHISGVSFEQFNASEGASHQAAELDEQFVIECVRTKKTAVIPVGRSILDVVLDEVDPAYEFDCKEGYCGTCETKVIAGFPDHRDDILTEAERAANDVMMICVSRAKTERLVLDI